MKKKKRRLRKGVIPTFFMLLLIILSLAFKIYQSHQRMLNATYINPFIRDGEIREWNLVLVNNDHPIKEDYSYSLKEMDNGQKVDSRIYKELNKMFKDANKDGISIAVTSGHREKEYQEMLMNNKINDYIYEGYNKNEAIRLAKKWVMNPGCSEHEIGLGLDINCEDTSIYDNADTWNWLLNNAYKYGFIKRYPSDKVAITGVRNEPWHYRYVGIDAAKKMYEEDLCLEEYLQKRFYNLQSSVIISTVSTD